MGRKEYYQLTRLLLQFFVFYCCLTLLTNIPFFFNGRRQIFLRRLALLSNFIALFKGFCSLVIGKYSFIGKIFNQYIPYEREIIKYFTIIKYCQLTLLLFLLKNIARALLSITIGKYVAWCTWRAFPNNLYIYIYIYGFC